VDVHKAVNFAGVLIHALTYEAMFVQIDRWIQDKGTRSHHIACINAYCVALALDSLYLASIYNSADIAGPDGMPFVYWIRWVQRRSCERFYAPEIVSRLIARSEHSGYTFYFYGGAPDVLEKMIEGLRGRHPYLRVVGSHSPPFRRLTEEEDRQICERINQVSPDIVCVGLGTPKQDYWIDEHLNKIPGSVMISCGATFDFFGGRVRMAPKAIQQMGLEWLFRFFGQDRTRLFRRYTVMHARFLWNFGLQVFGRRHLEAKRLPRP